MPKSTQTAVIEVPIEDVYQRENARRLNEELVGRIAESIRVVGYMPGKEITARKDGGIYWIIDGGHRHAACLRARRTTIPVLALDADDATTLAYEGVSNLQRPDTEEECWSRCQTFFALGKAARPEIIEVATGVDAEHQGTLRRAIKAINDPVAIEDVHSLDRMYAIAEFDDDREAVKRLINCRESDWRRVADGLRMERRLNANTEHAKRAIKKAGCKLVAHEGSMPDGVKWISLGSDKPEGATHARVRPYPWNGTCEIEWFGERGAEDADLAAQREQSEKTEAELALLSERRIEFVREYLSPDHVGPSNALRDFAVAQWEAGTITATRSRLTDPLDNVTGFLSRVYASVLIHAETGLCVPMLRSLADLSGSLAYYLENYGATTSAFLEALTECGYTAVPLEQELYGKLRNALDQSTTTEEEAS